MDMTGGLVQEIERLRQENARLREEQCQRVAQLGHLLETSHAVVSSLALGEVLELVLSGIRGLLGANAAAAWKVEAGGRLQRLAAVGLSDAYVTAVSNIPLDEGITGLVVREARPVAVQDISAEERVKVQALLTREGIRSFLSAPLLRRGRVIGALTVYYEEVRAFSQTETELLVSFANQAAAAIENARLYESLRQGRDYLDRRNRELSALNAIATTASKSMNLSEVLTNTLHEVVRLWELQAGAMFLADEAAGELHLFAEEGLPSETAERICATPPRLADSGHALAATQPGLAIVSADPSLNPLAARLVPPGAGPVATVPLETKGRVLGVLAVIGRQPFRPEDVRLLTSVASTIAVAAENALLHSQTEQALAEVSSQKEMLASIVQNAQDGILALDANFGIVVFSPGCERLSGWRADEVLGRSCAEFFKCHAPGERPLCHRACPLEPFLRANGPARPYVELQIHTRSGRERWIGASLASIRGSAGSPARAVMVLRDITAAKEMDQMKSAIISTVSHELRTPLTSIRALSELMVDHEFGPAEGKAIAAQLNQESVRLTRLVENILDVARIEAGHMPCEPVPLKLGQLLEQAVSVLRQASAHHFRLELDQALPPVFADADRLREILDNLLSNAVKYSPDGGEIVVRARVAEGRTGGGGETVPSPSRHVVVEVEDRGIGIPTEHLSRIFDRFHRVDSTDVRKMGGTGLGLYITKNLVGMLGGEIFVRSTVGLGSTFSFTLPIASAYRPTETEKEAFLV